MLLIKPYINVLAKFVFSCLQAMNL
jgi:hypothetical protein